MKPWVKRVKDRTWQGSTTGQTKQALYKDPNLALWENKKSARCLFRRIHLLWKVDHRLGAHRRLSEVVEVATLNTATTGASGHSAMMVIDAGQLSAVLR